METLYKIGITLYPLVNIVIIIKLQHIFILSTGFQFIKYNKYIFLNLKPPTICTM
jgi:hypothetical protein